MQPQGFAMTEQSTLAHGSVRMVMRRVVGVEELIVTGAPDGSVQVAASRAAGRVERDRSPFVDELGLLKRARFTPIVVSTAEEDRRL